MLSTKYRLRLQYICKQIANGDHIGLRDRIWSTKLGEVNRAAATMLRQAHRKALNPQMPDGGLDAFLNALDLGSFDREADGIRRFNSPDEIADFFRQQKPDDWRQHD